MEAKIVELIAEARKELRRASGIPPTPEEIEEDRRKKEVEELDDFLYSKLRIGTMFAFNGEVTWHQGSLLAQFTLEGKKFYLRPAGQNFEFFSVRDGEERLLLQLSREDPLFGKRLVVAIGDNLH